MKTNKRRLALLVWSAMFPFSTAITYGLAELPFTAHWPVVARTFCLTCVLVPYMVFGVFPFLNRHFTPWLQRGGQPQNAENRASSPATEAENAPGLPPVEPGGLSVSLTQNGDGLRAEPTPVLHGIAA